MSRVGKKPILIPEGVEVNIEDQKIEVKGQRGELSREIRPEIEVFQKDGKIFVSPRHKGAKRAGAFWGLTRSLIANMVQGVEEGFEKKLKLKGLGFKATLQDNILVLQVGFTHPISVKAPEGVKFSVEGDIITVSGPDKEKVSQTAATIRKIRRPEPYKGTGIRYIDEKVRRKPGKRVISEGA